MGDLYRIPYRRLSQKNREARQHGLCASIRPDYLPLFVLNSHFSDRRMYALIVNVLGAEVFEVGKEGDVFCLGVLHAVGEVGLFTAYP
jgi:hypothetical protein